MIMMRRTEHLYADFREYATYHFALRTAGAIELDDRLGHHKTLGLDNRRHEFYKFRNWAVVSRQRNQTCELTLRYNIAWARALPVTAQYERAASQLPPGFLQIHFQAGTVDLQSRIDGGPEWTAENVRSLEITPNQKITVVSDSGQTFRPVSEPSPPSAPLFHVVPPNGSTEESGNEIHIPPQPLEVPSPPNAAEELERVQLELEEAQNERNQARENLARMREQFEQEQRRNAQLQTSLSGSLEHLAESLQVDLEHLNAALQEKTRAVQTRTAELETISQNVKTLDSDLKSIETQIEKLNELKEIRSMDCQQAREELNALRMQYQDDDVSLALLQENASPLLRNSTLRKTMNRIGEELDAAEQQIGRIIRWREAVNGTIQRTILEGNGLLNSDSELKFEPNC